MGYSVSSIDRKSSAVFIEVFKEDSNCGELILLHLLLSHAFHLSLDYVESSNKRTLKTFPKTQGLKD